MADLQTAQGGFRQFQTDAVAAVVEQLGELGAFGNRRSDHAFDLHQHAIERCDDATFCLAVGQQFEFAVRVRKSITRGFDVGGADGHWGIDAQVLKTIERAFGAITLRFRLDQFIGFTERRIEEHDQITGFYRLIR